MVWLTRGTFPMLDLGARCGLSQLAEQTEGAPPGLQRLPLRPGPAVSGQRSSALIRMESGEMSARGTTGTEGGAVSCFLLIVTAKLYLIIVEAKKHSLVY